MAISQQDRRAPRRSEAAQQEEKQFDERTLHIDRVARVVSGGRRFRFRALVAVGDHKGRVGVGIAKGADVTSAVTKATDVAKKNLITVPIYRNTIPHDVQAKVGGANILIMPASEGTGLIAGSVTRTLLEVAGVSNALSKSLGSNNRANSVYATLEALRKLVPAKDWVKTADRASSKRPVSKKATSATTEKETK